MIMRLLLALNSLLSDKKQGEDAYFEDLVGAQPMVEVIVIQRILI